METGKDQLKRVFAIYKNVVKMMIDRGYFVRDDDKNMDFATFEENYRERYSKNEMEIAFFKSEDEDQKIYIFFSSSINKFIKDDLKARLDTMMRLGITNAIIILQGETSVNSAEFEETYRIEFFKEEELLINVTEHELASKHILLSNEEKIELLKRYKVKESQLPKILVSDPFSRYYGYKRGDVVKIVRESETAGRYITYRLVS